MRRVHLEERLVKTPGNGCWEWTGPFNKDGYGRIGQLYAHRVAWESANGPIPPNMVVCHRCDNPPCARPDHLFLGTHADNARDCARKNRSRFGERSPVAKLTNAHVATIHEERQRGVLCSLLAQRFGVSLNTIWNIGLGRRKLLGGSEREHRASAAAGRARSEQPRKDEMTPVSRPSRLAAGGGGSP